MKCCGGRRAVMGAHRTDAPLEINIDSGLHKFINTEANSTAGGNLAGPIFLFWKLFVNICSFFFFLDFL